MGSKRVFKLETTKTEASGDLKRYKDLVFFLSTSIFSSNPGVTALGLVLTITHSLHRARDGQHLDGSAETGHDMALWSGYGSPPPFFFWMNLFISLTLKYSFDSE
jgi:hypothetical protein